MKKLALLLLIGISLAGVWRNDTDLGYKGYNGSSINAGIVITSQNVVGIGMTPNASYKLDVNGAIRATTFNGSVVGTVTTSSYSVISGTSNIALLAITANYLAVYPDYIVTNNYYGTITANYFVGDGSNLTGVIADTISGDVTLQSVTINGSLYVSSSAVSIFGDSVTINGNLYVSGNSNLGSGAGLSISQNPYSPNISPNYTTPNVVGQVWINTANYSMYMAAHTNNYAGWGYIGQASTTTFNKDTVAGLVSWHDASDASTVILSGTNVTGWDDKALTGKNMVVDNTSPTYVTSYQNGLNAILFNGSNQALHYDMADIPQPYTRVIVFKSTNWGTGSQQAIVGASSASTIYKANGNTNLTIYSGSALTYGSLANTTPYIIIAVFNGASSSIRVNGGTPVTGNAGASALTRVNMGGEYGYGNWWQGYGFENMVYTGAMSTADQDKIFTYLNNKWAVY